MEGKAIKKSFPRPGCCPVPSAKHFSHLCGSSHGSITANIRPRRPRRNRTDRYQYGNLTFRDLPQDSRHCSQTFNDTIFLTHGVECTAALGLVVVLQLMPTFPTYGILSAILTKPNEHRLVPLQTVNFRLRPRYQIKTSRFNVRFFILRHVCHRLNVSAAPDERRRLVVV